MADAREDGIETTALMDKDGEYIEETNRLQVNALITNTLVPSEFDYIELSYTDENLTQVIYKTGGSGGTIVATLTLVYDGDDNLTSVTKT